MATLHPFRALRPRPADAARIAAVPYDVVNTDEARALAEGNPLSFLRASRAELELPPGTDPYSAAVYERAASNFDALKKSSLVVEDEPSLYFYRLRMGAHEQTGLAGCFSLDEYDRDVIKKHERTRRDKEDDRTRHMMALGAQTGPVFLTLPRASNDVDRIAARVTAGRADDRFRGARRVCATPCGGSPAPIATRSSRRSAACRRSTSPTGITALRARRGRAPTSATRASRVTRWATTPTTRRSSAWRSRTTRCRSCRTTGS